MGLFSKWLARLHPKKEVKVKEPKPAVTKTVEIQPTRKYHAKPVRRSKTGLTRGAFGSPRRNRE